MRVLRLPLLLSILLASALPAQTRSIAERLGYPAGSKLLILHADDLGVAHSEDTASFDALNRGAVSSASVMIPTPWVSEVAAYFKAHPNVDLGLHLTLTSEWETYRWGSVEGRERVPSLLDSAGTFPNDESIVAKMAKPADVDRELRAQVERALALGIRPTHIDSHMGSLFTTPELVAIYVKVAHDYHVPFLAVKGSGFGAPGAGLSPQDVVLDAVVIADRQVPNDQWKAWYLMQIDSLKPGITEMIVHLAHDDSEMQAVTVNHDAYGAAWRQRDFDVVTSPEFAKALKDHNVIVVKWKDLYRAAQMK